MSIYTLNSLVKIFKNIIFIEHGQAFRRNKRRKKHSTLSQKTSHSRTTESKKYGRMLILSLDSVFAYKFQLTFHFLVTI